MNDLLILDIIIILYSLQNSVGRIFFGIFNNRAHLATLNWNVFPIKIQLYTYFILQIFGLKSFFYLSNTVSFLSTTKEGPISYMRCPDRPHHIKINGRGKMILYYVYYIKQKNVSTNVISSYYYYFFIHFNVLSKTQKPLKLVFEK